MDTEILKHHYRLSSEAATLNNSPNKTGFILTVRDKSLIGFFSDTTFKTVMSSWDFISDTCLLQWVQFVVSGETKSQPDYVINKKKKYTVTDFKFSTSNIQYI